MQVITREHRAPAIKLSPKEHKSYSLTRALDAAKVGSWRDAPFEREVSDELVKAAEIFGGLRPQEFMAPASIIQRRDLTVATASAGGFLVDDEVPSVIAALANRLILNRLGVQTITGLRGNQTVARVGAVATVSWAVNESTPASETATLSLGQLALAPKTLFANVEISRLLRLMSPDFAEMAVRNNLAQALAAAVETVAFGGSGASGQPLGIIGTAGVGSFNGGSITYDNVLESQADVLTANALGEASNLGYACTPAVARVLANRAAFSANTPLWSGALNAGTIVGAPAFSSLAVPAATLVCGDFAKLMLAEWGSGGIQITVNPYSNFQAGISGFQAALSCDVGLSFAAAFSVATSVS